MKLATIGLDLAKNVFQVHDVDAEPDRGASSAASCQSHEVLQRDRAMPWWAWRHGPIRAGSCHWAYVKAYVRRQKNDMADAAALCEAVTRPSMRFVPIKSEDQQALLLLHRARDLLVRQRTGLINALRAHLAEFGALVPKGAPYARKQSKREIDYDRTGQNATREGDEEAEPCRPMKPTEPGASARGGRCRQPCPVLAPSLELLVPVRRQAVE
jgi:transposase